MGALIDITIDLSGEKWGANSRSVHQENDILEASDSHPIVAVPSSFIHTLHNLSNVKLCTLEQVEVIFDIHVPSVGIVTPQPLLLPRLSDIKMSDMNCMTHLWRCNWRKFLMLHNPQQKSSFQNLTTIYMEKCKTIEYLFSPLMATLLSNLKKIHIENCNRFQEVVSNRDDEDDILKGTTNVRFPSLRSIILGKLPNLRGFFFGFSGKNELQLPLLDELVIERCPQMMAFTSLPLRAPKLEYIHINAGKYNSSFFMTTTTLPQAPSQSLNNTNSLTTISEEFLSYSRSLIEMNARGGWESRVFFLYDELPQLQNLEKLYARDCVSVLEVFDIGTEVRCSSSSQISVVELPKLSDVCLQYLESLKYIWMSNGRRTILEFPNLAKLSISSCNQLEHVFTCSMVGSLLQLKELSIRWCQNMEVIVKEDQEEEEEEGGDIGKVNEPIRLPCLKSLELGNLDSLKGFCLGNADYSFPSLESMSIKRCKSITTFTKGDLVVPELKVMETRSGTINLAEEQDINSFIITKTQEGFDL
uniref:uncharacterized protein LOC122604205 n=1 Tax=Erigeron canadensis TaxID=72917 RepID=UPI001CB94869|nr:uncharacterized protein LOC122604205 [Erigeron canadensis]